MKKKRNYSLTKDLLNKYIESALQNAADLLEEASFLLKNEYYPRAYFLACASLEETGKAYIAFSALGRNLRNPGVQTAVKMVFESHPPKIVSALVCLIRQGNISAQTIQKFLDLSLSLQYGREQTLYVDITDDEKITLPKIVTRPKAAFDCIRLAKDALDSTSNYLATNKPDAFSSYYDKIIGISTERISKILNTKDFWELYINSLSKNEESSDFVVAITKYHDEYYCKSRRFQTELKSDDANMKQNS